jgi:hypothetical protein
MDRAVTSAMVSVAALELGMSAGRRRDDVEHHEQRSPEAIATLLRNLMGQPSRWRAKSRKRKPW